MYNKKNYIIESCHTDKSCSFEEKQRDLAIFDVYSLLNYQPPAEYAAE